MKVNIDISIFTPTTSFGVITGTLDVSVIPRIGESISFVFAPNNDVTAPEGVLLPQLKVEHVIHASYEDGPTVSIMLEEANFESIVECRAVSEYLEKGFGLFLDEHG